MRKNIKLIGAVAVAGLVAATGSAFTGTGLSNTTTATQFVGGTVSQSVTGATLSGVTYDFVDDTTKTHVNVINLAFSATEDARTVAVAVTGGGSGTFSCTSTSGNASSCTYQPVAGDTTTTGYVDVDSLAITVS